MLKRVEIVVKDDAKFFRRSGAEAESSSEKNDVKSRQNDAKSRGRN